MRLSLRSGPSSTTRIDNSILSAFLQKRLQGNPDIGLFPVCYAGEGQGKRIKMENRVIVALNGLQRTS
jgi:hypothetical protein